MFHPFREFFHLVQFWQEVSETNEADAEARAVAQIALPHR
jgi:hypothetical protein